MQLTTKLFDSLVTEIEPEQKAAGTMVESRQAGGPAGMVSWGAGEASNDAESLRNYRRTNPWVHRCIAMRQWRVGRAEFDIVVDDETQPANLKAAARVKDFLKKPNPNGKGNSFGGQFGPPVDDILTLDKAGQQKVWGPTNEPKALRYLNGARLTIRNNWHTNADGPRYLYRESPMTQSVEFYNDDLVIYVGNQTTYDDSGLPPMLALRRVLMAEYDTFRSVHVLQKRRMPSGMLVLPSTDEQTLKRVEGLFRTQLEGRQSIGFIDVPGTQFINMGSVNLAQQGAFAFYDMLVRATAMAFGTTPLHLGWSQDINRSTAAASMDISDSGIVDLLKLIQEVINEQIIPFFAGTQNLKFVFLDLLHADEAANASIGRQLTGQFVNHVGLNEIRAITGQPLLVAKHPDPDIRKAIQMAYDLPLMLCGKDRWLPVPLAIEELLNASPEAVQPTPPSTTPLVAAGNGHAALPPGTQPTELPVSPSPVAP